MAVCGSLQHIFEKPLPENPTLIESLSQWNRNQMKTRKPVDLSSFNEIFGELHFHENNTTPDPDPSSSSSSSSSPPLPGSTFSLRSFLNEDIHGNADDITDEKEDNTDENPSSSSSSSSTWSSLSSSSSSSLDSGSHHSQGFSSKNSKNSDSLQLCTEGLGSESADDVEDFSPITANNEGFVFDDSNTKEEEEEEEEEMVKSSLTRHSMSFMPVWNCSNSSRRSPISRNTASPSSGSGSGSGLGPPSFPPPISCIGRSGKPSVCFKSYRRDGRFVLKEIRIPTQEFLHAFREDGRLRLHFVQPEEDIPEEEEEDEEEEEQEQEDNVGDEEEEEEVADDQGDVCKYHA